jgi:hypothetical protein
MVERTALGLQRGGVSLVKTLGELTRPTQRNASDAHLASKSLHGTGWRERRQVQGSAPLSATSKRTFAGGHAPHPPPSRHAAASITTPRRRRSYTLGRLTRRASSTSFGLGDNAYAARHSFRPEWEGRKYTPSGTDIAAHLGAARLWPLANAPPGAKLAAHRG